MTDASLLNRIETFCAERGMSPSTFGLKVVNDGKLVSRLAAGKTITLVTASKIEAFLSALPEPEDGAGVVGGSEDAGVSGHVAQPAATSERSHVKATGSVLPLPAGGEASR